jgi:(2Fe-2S) ferredoxin
MPRPKHQILVCTNERPPGADRPSCGRGGGLEVYHRLKDEVKARGLKNEVVVTRTGCLRHCSLGPTVVVWPGNHWCGGVRPELAVALLEQTLAGGGELAALAIPADARWE